MTAAADARDEWEGGAAANRGRGVVRYSIDDGNRVSGRPSERWRMCKSEAA